MFKLRGVGEGRLHMSCATKALKKIFDFVKTIVSLAMCKKLIVFLSQWKNLVKVK